MKLQAQGMQLALAKVKLIYLIVSFAKRTDVEMSILGYVMCIMDDLNERNLIAYVITLMEILAQRLYSLWFKPPPLHPVVEVCISLASSSY